jgi:thymidylate kinase
MSNDVYMPKIARVNIYIDGPNGIGKTTVIDHLVEQIASAFEKKLWYSGLTLVGDSNQPPLKNRKLKVLLSTSKDSIDDGSALYTEFLLLHNAALKGDFEYPGELFIMKTGAKNPNRELIQLYHPMLDLFTINEYIMRRIANNANRNNNWYEQLRSNWTAQIDEDEYDYLLVDLVDRSYLSTLVYQCKTREQINFVEYATKLGRLTMNDEFVQKLSACNEFTELYTKDDETAIAALNTFYATPEFFVVMTADNPDQLVERVKLRDGEDNMRETAEQIVLANQAYKILADGKIQQGAMLTHIELTDLDASDSQATADAIQKTIIEDFCFKQLVEFYNNPIATTIPKQEGVNDGQTAKTIKLN